MKNNRVKVRDYVTLAEINKGTSGYHKSLKDKERNRKSKQSQKSKHLLKQYMN